MTLPPLTHYHYHSSVTHRMGHNALRFVLEISSELRRHNAGSRTGQDHIIRRILIKISKHLFLQIHILRDAFLYVNNTHQLIHILCAQQCQSMQAVKACSSPNLELGTAPKAIVT